MDKPEVCIGGVKYQPQTPKMRVWRLVSAFGEEDLGKLTTTQVIDKYINIIVSVFDRPEVTTAALDDALDVADVIPLYRKCAEWIFSCAFEKLQKVPNVEAAKAQS